MSEGMIKAYFRQGMQYFSESAQQLRPISAMVPVHAANAATKLLREADIWAKEAGVRGAYPQLWMTGTPLFQALRERAN